MTPAEAAVLDAARHWAAIRTARREAQYVGAASGEASPLSSCPVRSDELAAAAILAAAVRGLA